MKETNQLLNVSPSTDRNLSNEISNENIGNTRRTSIGSLFHKLFPSTLRHHSGSRSNRRKEEKHENEISHPQFKDEKKNRIEHHDDIPSTDLNDEQRYRTNNLETRNEYGTMQNMNSYNDEAKVFVDSCSIGSLQSHPQRTKKLGSLRDESIKIDFLSDPISSMTFSRIIALFLMKLSWYVKSGRSDDSGFDSESCALHDSKKPSLAKAWAYFEHVTLPRYVVLSGASSKQGLLRAKPGEINLQTRLYSPILTPLREMGDFGIATGLYFSMLYSMIIIMFLAGVVSIPNIWFYQSDSYTPDGQGSINNWILKGSSICTNLTWVVCQGCNETNFELDPGRFAATKDKGLTFALKNDCKGAQLAQGMTHYVAMMVVIIGIIIMNYNQREWLVKFDEDEQTAQDYSLVVNNPPADAYDPDVWKSFFSQFGHVSCCTIALRNEMLLRLLADQKKILPELMDMLPPGSELNEKTVAVQTALKSTNRAMKWLQMLLQPFGLLLDISALYDKYASQNTRIRMLSQKKHDVSAVFITFETEEAQRSALATLSVGSIPAWFNYLGALSSPNHLFQGDLVLDVEEADEPSSICWEYLSVTFATTFKRVVLTTVSSIVAIMLIVFIVRTCHDASFIYSSFAVAGFNVAFPKFAGVLTLWEAHSSESSKEASLYVKIAVYRWVNTAVVMTIITPFTSSLSLGSNGLIPGICAIFFADIITTNLLQIADPVGNIKKHFLAPRKANQNLMDKQFEGKPYDLAERYTNATKIIFTVFCYCTFFPTAFFLGALALLINYYADRFSIMRTWAPAPKMGKQISEFNRKYFLSTAIVALVVVSTYIWSEFPYDNLCQDPSLVESMYVGNHTVYHFSHSRGTRFTANLEQGIDLINTNVAITESDHSFHFCSQEFWSRSGSSLKLLMNKQHGHDWMTNEQEKMTKIYGWTSIVIVIGVFFTFLCRFGIVVKKLFLSSYKPVGENQCQNFSDLDEIEGYIPQVKSPAYTYPLLACDISNIDENLLSWTDSDHGYDLYRLDHDMQAIVGKVEANNINVCHLFSSVTHWQP